MVFHPKKEQPDLASLITTLANSRIQTSNPALYQTIFALIQRAIQSQGLFVNDIKEINDSINSAINILNIVVGNLAKATFWTELDESLKFPNSVQVLAGSGITLDYSIPNEVTITGSGGGVLPMVTGAEPPQLMSNGAGDLIIIPYDADHP